MATELPPLGPADGARSAAVGVAALGGLAAGTLINKGYQAITDLTIDDDWASMDENLDF